MKKILLVMCLLVVGCKSNPPVVFDSLFSKEKPPVREQNLAEKMVKVYPKLQKICDKVGGCKNVTITCKKYDGAGNTNLRNSTWWEIDAGYITGYGYGTTTRNFDNHAAIKRAIEDYLENYRENHSSDDQPKDIYPNHVSCDKDCWK